MGTSLLTKAIITMGMAGGVVADKVDRFLFKFVFESEEFPEFGSSEYNEKVAVLLYGLDSAMLSDVKTVPLNNLVPIAPIDYQPLPQPLP